MQKCDVLIVGGGPAGSSCAWKLAGSGLDVLILDRHVFPRDKVCGGWITPAVLEALKIQPEEYAAHNILQPINGFRTGVMGGVLVETGYPGPVSYGMRRCEFDHYLLKRCGARLHDGSAFREMRRSGAYWIVNGSIQASVVVGAGGHFCPVARFLGAVLKRERVVAAQEIEFQVDEAHTAERASSGNIPELYFCPDLKGYGWCFRKRNYLNIGLGRMGNDGLSARVEQFLEFLKAAGKIAPDFRPNLKGHAYLLYGVTPRRLIGDGVLLIGDSAGLAYPFSGEGIRPAVESGLMAADVLLQARGLYSEENLRPYAAALARRFGEAGNGWGSAAAKALPSAVSCLLAKALFRTRTFSRRVVLDQWFLHSRPEAEPLVFAEYAD